MNLDFDKIWASDTSPDYPTDTQTKRGLSYLGTEPPTFDLHDAIFQRLDKKDQWLYDQVRLACERFGQNVSESVAGASRDTMANAITNALLTQRKADEGGYGIVKMANSDQTNAGQEYNLAVSPKHLSEYVAAKNTWENTQNKPQTATRWPDYSEVTNTPKFGAAAWKGFFDTGSVDDIPYGSSYAASTGCVAATRDFIKSIRDSMKKVATTGGINDTEGVLSKEKGGTGRSDGSIDFDVAYITKGGTNGGLRFKNPDSASGDELKIVSGLDNGDNLSLDSNLNIDTWNGLGVRDSSNNFVTAWKVSARTGAVRQRGDITMLGARGLYATGDLTLSGYGTTFTLGSGNLQAFNKGGEETFHVYSDGTSWFKGKITGGGLGSSAYLNHSDISVNELSGKADYVTTTKQTVELRDAVNNKINSECITDARSIFLYSAWLDYGLGTEYGTGPGEFVGSMVMSKEKKLYIQIRRSQVYKNGSWVTVRRE